MSQQDKTFMVAKNIYEFVLIFVLYVHANKDLFIKKIGDTEKKASRNRSSYQRFSIKKAIFKTFAIFTGKHLCWSLFLKTLQSGKHPKSASNTGVFL